MRSICWASSGAALETFQCTIGNHRHAAALFGAEANAQEAVLPAALLLLERLLLYLNLPIYSPLLAVTAHGCGHAKRLLSPEGPDLSLLILPTLVLAKLRRHIVKHLSPH